MVLQCQGSGLMWIERAGMTQRNVQGVRNRRGCRVGPCYAGHNLHRENGGEDDGSCADAAVPRPQVGLVWAGPAP